MKRLLLVLLLLMAATFVFTMVLYHETPAQVWERFMRYVQGPGKVEPAPSPVPTPTLIPTPTPEPTAAPTPTPRPIATPTPTPPPDPLAWVIGHKEYWPKEVVLKEATTFPVVFDGKIAGWAKVPEGTMVKVVAIEPTDLAVVYDGGGARVPFAATDLRQRATAAMASVEAEPDPAPLDIRQRAMAVMARTEQRPGPVPGAVIAASASPAGATSLGPRTFVHPGIPLTKEDLDEVKRNIAREPWKSAFEALKNDPRVPA